MSMYILSLFKHLFCCFTDFINVLQTDPVNSVLANIGLHFYNKVLFIRVNECIFTWKKRIGAQGKQAFVSLQVTTRQNSKQKENTEMLVFRVEGATDEEEEAGGTEKDLRRFHHFSQT